MRKAEAEVEILALDRGLEADAFDLEILGEAFAHADDHVVDQRAGKTVQRFQAARLGIADERHLVIGHVRLDPLRQRPVEFPFRTFDRDLAAVVDVHFHFGGNFDRLFSNS